MKCDHCGREGANEIRMVINGKQSVVHLCTRCFLNIGKKPEPLTEEVLIADIAAPIGVFGFAFGGPSPVPRDIECRHCGTKASEFYRAGFVGCPHCYTELAGYMESAVRGSQKGTRHVGKRPRRMGKNPIAAEYNALLIQLETAKSQNNFDDMNRISARLSELNGESR